MKKILTTVAALLLISILGVRIWYINSSVITIPVETYKVGEWVELDGAFQDVSYENTDGYSLRVKSAAIKSYSEGNTANLRIIWKKIFVQNSCLMLNLSFPIKVILKDK